MLPVGDRRDPLDQRGRLGVRSDHYPRFLPLHPADDDFSRFLRWHPQQLLEALALDRDLLVQAMLNLARNAVQALGATGRLTLRSRALTHATIGTERHRVVASLQFEDDGPGVPPELGETIFYPLVTARAGGTGLGLAVAQDIATRHGGIIEFDSRPGRTVFSLLLPMENGHDEAA